MKTSQKFSYIVLLFATLVLIHQGDADEILFHRFCKRTGFKDLCTSIIKSDPRENLKNSTNGLCMILRDRALSDAEVIATKISNLLKNETNLASMKCLQDCSKDYELAVLRLQFANFTYINEQSYLGLNRGIADVERAAYSCETCFSNKRPTILPSPLTSENVNLEHIAATIVAILNLTECDKKSDCLEM